MQIYFEENTRDKISVKVFELILKLLDLSLLPADLLVDGIQLLSFLVVTQTCVGASRGRSVCVVAHLILFDHIVVLLVKLDHDTLQADGSYLAFDKFVVVQRSTIVFVNLVKQFTRVRLLFFVELSRLAQVCEEFVEVKSAVFVNVGLNKHLLNIQVTAHFLEHVVVSVVIQVGHGWVAFQV